MIPIRAAVVDELKIAQLVPDGVRPTDKRHIDTNDGTCSRCGQQPPVWPKPLMLYWPHGVLLIYCQGCLQEGKGDEF